MGRNKQLKIMRKEARKAVAQHVTGLRDEASDAIAAARQATIERTRQVLRPRPRWLPRIVWRILKAIVLQYPLRDEQ
jgi:hypothetical protein